MIDEPVSKFTRPAEVLPNNAKTAKILKDREEIAQQKAEREKAVSSYTPCSCFNYCFAFIYHFY